MQATKNFVCQLVEAQMTRYLAGHPLSDEALAQLDQHIASCPECKAVLEAKKAEILGVPAAPMHPPKPGAKIQHALVDAPAAMAVAAAVAPKPHHRRDAGTANAKPRTKWAVQWKPLALSVALAVVMVAMSLVAQNPTSVLGPKASSKLPEAAKPAPVPVPAATEQPIAEGPIEPAPEPGSPEFIGPDAPAAGSPTFDTLAEYEASLAPANPPPAEPEPAVPVVAQPKPTPKRTVRRTPVRRPAPQPQNSRPTIRVYDAQGRPIAR